MDNCLLLTFIVTNYIQNNKLKDENKLKKLEELLSLIIKAEKVVNEHSDEYELISKIEVLTMIYLLKEQKNIKYWLHSLKLLRTENQKNILKTKYITIHNSLIKEMNIT